ncbi:hypothetical protein GQR58_015942 [Nymphon striatum]|nr:hypothetical protein GQR58_015942 [Nymphon striatum]
MVGTTTAHEASTAPVVMDTKLKLKQVMENMRDSRTAKLWMMYMEMIDILKMFIKAERTGNWKQHLVAISLMLPYLAASGHNLYTKSAQLYLQHMTDLEASHPDVWQKFEEGFHVVRRSDRMWAGLSSDLVIEQVLMQIGMKILDSMMGKTVTEFNFKRSNQAITLASKTSVHIDGEDVQVDPQLLFQRLILASKSSENMQGIFKYELCSYPAALSDSSLMLRQPQKAVLADAMWKMLSRSSNKPTGPVQYVLDGGALLHHVCWPKDTSYDQLCRIYVDYVTRKYGEAIIVFDGYGENSTKDMTQQRRSGGKTAPAVTFTKEMKLTMKIDIFLSNPQNKQRLLNMLSESLNENNCKTLHAESDVDVLIATAVEAANLNTTVLVGDDTDLLILLCHHFKPGRFDLYFQPEPKVTSKKNRTWNIKLVKQDLGDAVCDGILFIHAILGSDTTSHVHGFGKGASLKKYESIIVADIDEFVAPKDVSLTLPEIVSHHEKHTQHPVYSFMILNKFFCQEYGVALNATKHLQNLKLKTQLCNDIGKDLLMGTVYGNRGRGRLKTRFSDNSKEIGNGRSFVALYRMAQDRVSWRATAVQFEPTVK